MQIDPYCQRRKCMGRQTRKWSSNMPMLSRVYLSITLAFMFLCVTQNFAGFPMLNCTSDFYSVSYNVNSGLLHSWRDKNAENVRYPPFFQKHLKMAWIGIFQPNRQNMQTFVLSKLLQQFQPNFAHSSKTSKMKIIAKL